jgi:hypothetical protein
MKYNLQRKLELTLNENSSRPWHFKEISDNGTATRENWLPFSGSNWWFSENAEYCLRYEQETYDDKSLLKSTDGIVTDEYILADLFPLRQEKWSTDYSFFGTDRIVNLFRLVIRKTNDKERCFVSGSPSHTHDWDYTFLTTKDRLFIYLDLNTANFDRVRELATCQNITSLTLLLIDVPGFYSTNGDIQVRSDLVKILPRGVKELFKHPIPEGLSVHLLDEVKTFFLNINGEKEKIAFHHNLTVHNNKMNPKPPQDGTDQITQTDQYHYLVFEKLLLTTKLVAILLSLILVSILFNTVFN